jgi:hypothetical protein
MQCARVRAETNHPGGKRARQACGRAAPHRESSAPGCPLTPWSRCSALWVGAQHQGTLNVQRSANLIGAARRGAIHQARGLNGAQGA